MKPHMTDDYLSPDVHWYAQSSEALPSSFGEGLVEDEARIEQYRTAGMHAEADRQVELVVRRKESISQQTLAQYYRPMGDLEELLRSHFSTRKEPSDYQGEGETGVPAEVLAKLIELRDQKLELLQEELLADYNDDPIFDKIKFWVAEDGEVLVVGTKKFGELRHKYLLAQWRPDGKPYTSPEVLRDRQVSAELQATEAKAARTRKRWAFALAYFVWVVLCVSLWITAIIHGKILFAMMVVCIWSIASMPILKQIEKLKK